MNCTRRVWTAVDESSRLGFKVFLIYIRHASRYSSVVIFGVLTRIYGLILELSLKQICSEQIPNLTCSMLAWLSKTSAMAAKEKSVGELDKAKSLAHVPWCDEYEKMISGML